jgi:hypothetical protein
MALNPVRIGQANGAGDDQALFLTVYGGEVLTAFRERNVFLARHIIRSISNGKSAQFPATWKSTASYLTPGNQLTGQTINNNQRTIAIDDLLVSDLFMYDLDEAMSHFETRSEYSFQAGAALAKKFDTNVAQVGYLAAQASATVTGGSGGSAIVDADAGTNGASLAGSIFDAVQALDEKDVPEDSRFSFVAPAQYYLLVETDKLLNRDFGGNPGVYMDGTIWRVAGTEIVKTNHLPNGTVVATGPSAYQGTFTNSVSLVMHRSAVGTVKLMDMGVEQGRLIDYQGDMLVARMAVGHGILRPESAVEIKSA